MQGLFNVLVMQTIKHIKIIKNKINQNYKKNKNK